MFKRKALRVVAGMIFGSAAGILWGAWFNAAKASELVSGDEVAQMNALLDTIMFGSAIGFLVGLIIGMARNSMATGIVAGATGIVAAALLPPGFGVAEVEDMRTGVLLAGGLIGAVALVAAITIPPKAAAVTAAGE